MKKFLLLVLKPSSYYKWAFSLIFLCCFFSPHSQTISLKIISKDSKSIVSSLNYRKKFPAEKDALREIDNVLRTLQGKGYLLAEVDSISKDSAQIAAIINEGEIYKTAQIKLGNLNPNLASKLGISEKLYLNKPMKYKEVAKSFEKIVVFYENNGYPFVSVKLDSIVVESGKFSAKFNVELNKFFKIDSVKIIGTAKINKGFIDRYLGAKDGMTYNESVFAKISKKTKQLPFITEKQEQRVQLTDRYNKLLLFYDKKNASQFDGIIGFLPDADAQKTTITGDLKLKVVNGVFRNGETFDLEWRRLQTQTQDFNGRIIYPFLFGTPIGTDYAIKIYRRDSTFIDVNNNIGIQYYYSGLNNFKVFYKQRNTNLISTNGLESITTLPDYADVRVQAYGMGIFYENLDYRFNPHKGIAVQLTTQTGDRKIKKNPAINPEAYNDVDLQSTQYQIEGSVAAFLQLHLNHVLKLGIQGAGIFGDSDIFTNELFRIGGLKTLRGFDEESIYASTYFIPTIEYRFLYAKNSNIFLFAEGAWYENNSNKKYISDTPVSMGAGINFETKAGILTLNYALGNQFNNGFDIRNGKIHFGLTALF